MATCRESIAITIYVTFTCMCWKINMSKESFTTDGTRATILKPLLLNFLMLRPKLRYVSNLFQSSIKHWIVACPMQWNDCFFPQG